MDGDVYLHDRLVSRGLNLTKTHVRDHGGIERTRE